MTDELIEKLKELLDYTVKNTSCDNHWEAFGYLRESYKIYEWEHMQESDK